MRPTSAGGFDHASPLGGTSEQTARLAGDIEDRWTLHAADRALLGNRTGVTRLGFAVLLKSLQAEGRFPRRPEDVPAAAVEAIAGEAGVAAATWQGYDRHGRTTEYHRAQIRAALGFREATLDDAEALGRRLDGQALALECRPDQRLVRCVLRQHEDAFCATLFAGLPPEAITGLDALLRPPDTGEAGGNEDEPDPATPLLAVRSGTGQASLQSVGEEAARLTRIRSANLPAGLFDGVSSRMLLAYRRRVGAEELHELRRHPDPIRLTLPAATRSHLSQCRPTMPLRDAPVRHAPSADKFSARLGLHALAQDPVDLHLIPVMAGAEPMQDVGIDADADGLLAQSYRI